LTWSKSEGPDQPTNRRSRKRHGTDIPGHNEVQADEQGENGRAVRSSEKQPGAQSFIFHLYGQPDVTRPIY